MTTSLASQHASAGAIDSPDIRRVVVASALGTIIEWYDFLIYGTAAALVLNKLFFPATDALVGTLAALASAAVGFFARPLGAAVFGYFGDRLGRKAMLLTTLAIMGLGTLGIGLLPTYQQIGVWAPILLVALRIIQGIGLGGEWGSAALMVMEHSPANRRGFAGSLVQIGFPIGVLLSAAAYAIVSRLPEADFMSWGWRVPFLASVVLIAVGAFVRTRVSESPVFLDMKARNQISDNPFLEALSKNRKSFFLAVGLKLCEVSWVYLLTVFLVVYATKNLGLPKSTMLSAIMVAAAIELVTIPLFGALSDRIGRRPLFFAGAIFTLLFAFPLFWLLELRSPWIVIATMSVAMSLGHGLMFSPEASYFPELFGARVRSTGASFGFQVSAAVGGGLSPIAATLLVGRMGGTAGVSILLLVLGAITFVSALLARETLNRSIRDL